MAHMTSSAGSGKMQQDTCASSTRRIGGRPASEYIWLAYSVFFLIDPFMRRHRIYWLGSAAAYLVFLGIYITYIHTRNTRLRYWLLGGFFVLGLATLPFNTGAMSFFIYSAAFLPFILDRVAMLRLILVAECLVVGAESLLLHGRIPDMVMAATAFFIVVVGTANTFIAQQKRADSRLRLANEEIEQLAALAERERIARDLHDVLGHTLSVVVLKAELAGRLLASGGDPARAASEIADVERTARTALAEVREAIGGYRAKGLGAEIEMARSMLATAGVAFACDTPVPRLAPAEETVLALALREAVTNIVRHARARQCTVSFSRADDASLSLRVQDDGVGMDGAVALLAGGNGLRGMRERVQAMGGRFSVSGEGPGTALRVDLPVTDSLGEKPVRAAGLVEA